MPFNFARFSPGAPHARDLRSGPLSRRGGVENDVEVEGVNKGCVRGKANTVSLHNGGRDPSGTTQALGRSSPSMAMTRSPRLHLMLFPASGNGLRRCTL